VFVKSFFRLLALAFICVPGLGSHSTWAQLQTLSVFIQPDVTNDAAWMAEAKGLFKAEGLDVQFRLFPSGTTAIQTFKVGVGDIIFTGDLPALQYWQAGGPYRIIAPMERDSEGYLGVTTDDIKKPGDLAGKTIATRVGSTGSYFISEYLTKNGVSEASVVVKNLDPPLMPTALCRGDISGFFVWQPMPSKALQVCGDKVHYLTTATGYVRGYSVMGARPEFLASPAGRDKAIRFLRALVKGADMADDDFATDAAIIKQKFGLEANEVKDQRAIMERVLKFDAAFFADFCSENKWQQRAGLQKGPSDLSNWVWEDGLKAVDPSRVTAAPPPC
jgi:ABC-type nitrate/sulfonate/bicarbonate transport system substrate-binding protein